MKQKNISKTPKKVKSKLHIQSYPCKAAKNKYKQMQMLINSISFVLYFSIYKIYNIYKRIFLII